MTPPLASDAVLLVVAPPARRRTHPTFRPLHPRDRKRYLLFGHAVPSPLDSGSRIGDDWLTPAEPPERRGDR